MNDANTVDVEVWKVGGSLLARRGWEAWLTAVLRDGTDRRPLLVVGGGGVADVVREWDRTHELGDVVSHDVAVASLAVTRRLVEHRLPGAVACASREGARRAWERDELPLLDVEAFLAEEEPDADRLPRSWAVTTDSIAAWVAIRWPAASLVLVKSAPGPPSIADWADAARRGWVDEHFPNVAAGVPRIDWRTMPAAFDGRPAGAYDRELASTTDDTRATP